MSIVTRPRRLSESLEPSCPSGAESLPAVPAARAVVEAPERGTDHREAPESRAGCRAEAPDAGEGRASYLEHEFTQGRSQS